MSRNRIFYYLFFWKALIRALPATTSMNNTTGVLIEGAINDHSSSLIELPRDYRTPTNIFGWIKLVAHSEPKRLSLITIEGLEHRTGDRYYDKHIRTAREDLLDLEYVSNHLILTNKQGDIDLRERAHPLLLSMDQWNFFVLTLDQSNGQILVRIMSPDPAKKVLEFWTSLECYVKKSMTHLEINFGPKFSNNYGVSVHFRDIAYLNERVNRLDNLPWLSPFSGRKYLDFVFQFNTNSEIDELRNNYIEGLMKKPIGFYGKETPIDDNGWPLLDTTSEFWIQEENYRSNQEQFFLTRTYHLNFEILCNSIDEVLLFSVTQSIQSNHFGFRLKLKSTGHKGEWHLAFKFAGEDEEHTFKHSINPKVIYSVFLTISIVQQKYATVFLKVGDDFQLFSIQLGQPLAYSVVKLLDRLNKHFPASIKLYRFFTSENPTSFVGSDLLGLEYNGNTNKPNHCNLHSSIIPNSHSHCLICNRGFYLNLQTKECGQVCPEDRIPDVGICVNKKLPLFSTGRMFTLSNQLQKPSLTPTLSNDNSVLENKRIDMSGQHTELNQSSEYQSWHADNHTINQQINLDKIQRSKKLMVNRNLSHEAAEGIENISSSTNGNNTIIDAMSSNNSIVIADDLSLNSSVAHYENPLEADHKKAHILGIVTVSIFCIGLLVGIIGCLYPFSLPKESFYFQKVIQSILCYQYICFWYLYDISLPWLLHDYMHYLYEYSIKVQQVLLRNLPNLSKQADAVTSTQTRLFNLNVKGMHPNIIGNFALGLIVQVAVLIIVGIMNLIAGRSAKTLSGLKPNFGNEGLSFTSWISQTRWKPIFAVFIMFALEISAFSIFEFMQVSFNSPIQIVSFILAVLVLLALAMQIFVLAAETLRSKNDFAITNSLSFASAGIRKGFRRLYLPLQLIIYLVMGVIFVVPIPDNLTPVIVNLTLTSLLFIFSLVRIPEKRYWRNEQMIFHFLMMASNAMVFTLQIGTNSSSFGERISAVLSYTAIGLMLLTVAWNSFILVESLVREIRSAKNRILMQSIFNIKTIATQGIKFRGFDSQYSPSNENKQCDSKNNLEARMSERVVCDLANMSYDIDMTRNNDDSILGEKDNLVQSKLREFNYPSKLSKLKDCNFLSQSISQSGKTVRKSMQTDDTEIVSLNENYLTQIQTTEAHPALKLQDLSTTKDRSFKPSSYEKNEARKFIGQTRLSPMANESDLSEHQSHHSVSQKSTLTRHGVGFNQILTASRLHQLGDSVSFLKRKNDRDYTVESVLDDPIIPTLSAITREGECNHDGTSPMLSRISQISRISKVVENDDDDNQTIKEHTSSISLSTIGNQKSTLEGFKAQSNHVSKLNQ